MGADNAFNGQNAEEAAEIKKRRTFRKFSYRGIDLDKYVLTSPSHPQPIEKTTIDYSKAPKT